MFNSAFKNLSTEHSPLKAKILRYNNKTFITKELRKEIMKMSKLNNLFKKKKKVNKIGANIKFNEITLSISYIKQKNIVIKFRYQRSHRQ